MNTAHPIAGQTFDVVIDEHEAAVICLWVAGLRPSPGRVTAILEVVNAPDLAAADEAWSEANSLPGRQDAFAIREAARLLCRARADVSRMQDRGEEAARRIDEEERDRHAARRRLS